MIDTPVKPSATEPPDLPDDSTTKAWWIVGGSITGAVLITAMAAFGVWFWAVGSPDQSFSRSQTYDRAVTAANVSTEIGTIRLEAASGNALTSSIEAKWRGAEAEYREDWNGDAFTAVGDCDETLFIGFDFDHCETNYTIGLPAGTDAVALAEVGDVRLDGLDGAIDASADVGDITGDRLSATGVSAETGVGDISLAFDQVLGDIDVHTGTGDVEIVVPDDGTTYRVVFDSGVGDQNIDIATDPAAEADRVIYVETGVGSLTVRYGA